MCDIDINRDFFHGGLRTAAVACRPLDDACHELESLDFWKVIMPIKAIYSTDTHLQSFWTYLGELDDQLESLDEGIEMATAALEEAAKAGSGEAWEAAVDEAREDIKDLKDDREQLDNLISDMNDLFNDASSVLFNSATSIEDLGYGVSSSAEYIMKWAEVYRAQLNAVENGASPSLPDAPEDGWVTWDAAIQDVRDTRRDVEDVVVDLNVWLGDQHEKFTMY